jgi:hypothetical protein
VVEVRVLVVLGRPDQRPVAEDNLVGHDRLLIQADLKQIGRSLSSLTEHEEDDIEERERIVRTEKGERE